MQDFRFSYKSSHVPSLLKVQGILIKDVLLILSLNAENEDYIPLNTTLTFALVTNDTRCITLSIVADFVLENDEAFFLQTMNSSLVTSIPPEVTITIQDNDSKYNHRESVAMTLILFDPTFLFRCLCQVY